MSNNISEVAKDSIQIWINKSKNAKYSCANRKLYLSKTVNELERLKSDSLSLKYMSSIAYSQLKLRDTLLFKALTKKALSLAEKHQDSFAIGDAHWNYASYFNNISRYDSAYYHFNTAEKYFKNSPYYIGRMLIGKSYIKGAFSDYLGSETLSFKAIRIFKQLKEYRLLANCYNHIGILQKELKNYDKALFYYNKALIYNEKSSTKKSKKLNVFNNIGLVYQKKETIIRL